MGHFLFDPTGDSGSNLKDHIWMEHVLCDLLICIPKKKIFLQPHLYIGLSVF